MPGKSTLAAELRRRFDQEGRPLVRVALDLGLSVNSLRSWLRRNRYPEGVLSALAVSAGLSGDVRWLAGHYLFSVAREKLTPSFLLARLLAQEVPDPHEAMALLDQGSVPERDGITVLEAMRLLFRTLSVGDLYVHCGLDGLPWEWEGAGAAVLAKDIAAAVKRGATLVYLHPSDAQVAAALAAGIYGALAPEVVEQAMSAFRIRLTDAAKGLPAAQVTRQVVSVSTGTGFFLTPGHMYVLIRHRQTGLTPRLLLRLRLRNLETTIPAQLPSNDGTAGCFLAWLLLEVERSGQNDLRLLLT